MNWTQKIQAFLSQPIDRVFDVCTSQSRAKDYAKEIDIEQSTEFLKIDELTFLFEIDPSLEFTAEDFKIIRHPFSDGELKISPCDKNEVFAAFKKFFAGLKTELNQKEDRYKFFYLWRKLREEIFHKNSEAPWAKYIPILPADPRVVDIAIWDFLKIISMIYLELESRDTSLKNNSLLLFTLGPVQSFVAQARKTMDFYMGSFMLSYFTFKAIEVVFENYGPTNLIYPDLYGQPLMDMYLVKNFQFTFSNHLDDIIHLPTIPNRFVALLPTNRQEEIQNLAQQMTEKIKQVKEEALSLVLQNFLLKISEPEKNKIFSQLQEFPECYWVAFPFGDDEHELNIRDLKDFFSDELLEKYEKLLNFMKTKSPNGTNLNCVYETFYSTLEKFIGARKNIRNFVQGQVAERGRKCTVCGERDVVFFRESKNKAKFTNFNKKLVDLTGKNIDLKFISEGEGLCCICFLKRTFGLYLKNSLFSSFKLSFPSTSEIAMSNFKEYAVQQAADEFYDYVRKFQDILGNKFPEIEPIPKLKAKLRKGDNLEGYWFFEENLTQESIEENLGKKVTREDVENLRLSLKKLTQKVKTPSPYYAIVYVDGDNMGKWLSGEFLPEIKNSYSNMYWEKLKEVQHPEGGNYADLFMKNLPLNDENKERKLLNPAIHSSISTALGNYTLKFVTQIVEKEHGGKLVYAGGDDLLALVVVDDLFDVMHKLRWAFSGQICLQNGKITVDLCNQTGFVEKDGQYILTMGRKASLSMGVVISHYKNPMQLTIKKVFEMEKFAKAQGKNGFAICLMKRSHNRIVSAKWLHNDKNPKGCFVDTIVKLKELQKVFSQKNESGFLSKSFLQKASLEFAKLKDEKGNFLANPSIFYEGLKRILARSYQNTNFSGKKEGLESIYKLLLQWFSICQNNLDNFLNFCYFANFMENQEN